MKVLRRILSALSVVLLAFLGMTFGSIVAMFEWPWSPVVLGTFLTFVISAVAHVLGSALSWHPITTGAARWRPVLGLVASCIALLIWVGCLVAASNPSSAVAAGSFSAAIAFGVLGASALVNATCFVLHLRAPKQQPG